MIPGEQMRGTWEQADLDSLLDGMSRMEFTLRFTLSHPDLDATIVGTRNLEHLQENIGFAEKGPLPGELYEEAKRRLAQAGSAPA
jgi:aryl-alcohol dehydrogenase-like predicted oxidoreductase